MTSHDYINLSLAMYVHIASGGVVPLQRFAVDSFIMLMSDRVRTISGPANPLHVQIWKVLGSKYNVR